MDLTNKKYHSLNDVWMTFFTATYNRAGTLPRCYECMKKMRVPVDESGKRVEFEWVIVDDGSEDNTRQLVEGWIEEDIVPVRYHYQPNQGKHVASNVGAMMARGEMIMNMDSDDTYFPESVEVFYKSWMDIPQEIRHGFRGVTARCVDPDTGETVGTPLPEHPYYVSTADMRLRDKVKGEMCGFNRTQIMRENPFPTFAEHTSYCPESILWLELSKRYKESVIDVPLREYYHDTNNAITGRSTNRSRANYHLWKYELNNVVLRYLRYSPKEMMKAVVGLSMDGFRTGRSVKTMLADVKPLAAKALVMAFIPVGWILSRRR